MSVGNPECSLLLLNQEFDLQSLREICATIKQVVDFDKSELEGRISLKLGLDDELDYLRKKYDFISSDLTNASEKILSTVSLSEMYPTAETLNVIYLPQVGFLTCLSFENDVAPDEEILEKAEWEFQFKSEHKLYFKNELMLSMDNEIGDIQKMLVEKEIEFLYELIKFVREFQTLLFKAEKCCGIIDALVSLTESAKRYNLTKPEIVEDPEISFTGGRHILQEMCLHQFVKNKFSTKDSHACFLITGPNNSGKSILLKQIGMLAVMAQAGSFVPCDTCTIGIFKRILTRIKSVETISRQKSSFMIDLQQISYAIKNSKDSLLLMDEFGKGTRNQDGIGLLSSTLKYLQDRSEVSLVFAITHHLEAHKFLKNLNITFYKMSTLKHEDGTLTYMYELESGFADGSYGIECAANAEMPTLFLEKAKLFFDALKNKTSIKLDICQNTDKIERTMDIFTSLSFDSDADIDKLVATIHK
eukprot:NODE_461_length_7178_cov_0.667185.p1 type:complete len:474 gc:universal NODE_461_length_7178_cov_0.667185:2712-1291(-)